MLKYKRVLGTVSFQTEGTMHLDLNLAVTSRLEAKKLLIISLNLEKGLKKYKYKMQKNEGCRNKH